MKSTVLRFPMPRISLRLALTSTRHSSLQIRTILAVRRCSIGLSAASRSVLHSVKPVASLASQMVIVLERLAFLLFRLHHHLAFPFHRYAIRIVTNCSNLVETIMPCSIMGHYTSILWAAVKWRVTMHAKWAFCPMLETRNKGSASSEALQYRQDLVPITRREHTLTPFHPVLLRHFVHFVCGKMIDLA